VVCSRALSAHPCDGRRAAGRRCFRANHHIIRLLHGRVRTEL